MCAQSINGAVIRRCYLLEEVYHAVMQEAQNALERVAAFQIQDSPTADVVIPCLEAHMGGANGQGASNRVASAGRRVCG